MFESSGEITEPCPIPFFSIVTIPSSRMPDRNHFWTSRMMRLSPIRCSRKRTTHCWETSVKNDRMSASSMKFTFLLLIPTMVEKVRTGGPIKHARAGGVKMINGGAPAATISGGGGTTIGGGT